MRVENGGSKDHAGSRAKLKALNTKEEKFEDVVKSAQDAAVFVLVY